MVPGNQNDGRPWKGDSEPGEFPVGRNDRSVRRAHLMEEVPGDEDEIDAFGNHPVDGSVEGQGDIQLALVRARGTQALVLPEPQVYVGQVGEFQNRSSSVLSRRDSSSSSIASITGCQVFTSFAFEAMRFRRSVRSAVAMSLMILPLLVPSFGDSGSR